VVLNTSTPRVAVVLNRSGMPDQDTRYATPARKTTRLVASVPFSEVKVQIHLERLLPLHP